MKQNEDLKRKVSPEARVHHSHVITAMTMTMKPTTQEIAEEKLQNTPRSQLVAAIK